MSDQVSIAINIFEVCGMRYEVVTRHARAMQEQLET